MERRRRRRLSQRPQFSREESPGRCKEASGYTDNIVLSHGTNDPAKSLTFAPPALGRIAGGQRTTTCCSDRQQTRVSLGVPCKRGNNNHEWRGRGGRANIGSRVNSVQLRYSVRDLYQAGISCMYNGAPGRGIFRQHLVALLLLFYRVLSVACRHRRNNDGRFLVSPLSKESTLGRCYFRYIEYCNYRRAGVSVYAARVRSRSKSLSRRRSFSITVERNYKGARNCSPRAPRVHRENRETHRRAAALFRKISSRRMDP